MEFVTQTMAVPLEIDEDGVVRVGGTRVTLDIVIGTFKDGATAEKIVQQYPPLKLADGYAVIAHYLRSQDEIDVYLQEQEQIAEAIQRQNETRFDPVGIRDRLLARIGERD